MEPFGSSVVAPPVSEPLTLDEVKLHCKIDTTDDDTLVTSLIIAARTYVENYLGMRLLTQTWDYFFDCFPGYTGEIELPYGLLQSLTTIKYLDTNNVQQTFSSLLYQVDTKRPRGRVKPVHNSIWPALYPNAYNRIEVRAIVGFGDDAADIPQTIRQAMLLMLEHWYDNRSAVEVGTIVSSVPLSAEILLSQERAYYFG